MMLPQYCNKYVQSTQPTGFTVLVNVKLGVIILVNIRLTGNIFFSSVVHFWASYKVRSVKIWSSSQLPRQNFSSMALDSLSCESYYPCIYVEVQVVSTALTVIITEYKTVLPMPIISFFFFFRHLV